VDWYVERTTYFVPDVVVTRRDVGPDPVLLDPPALVVEVLSPGTRRNDLGVKLHAYARAGLPWYWVVDPAATHLRVFERVGDTFAERASVVGDEPFTATQPFPVTFTPASLIA
jgi:Uma2 family endonuclease